MVKFQISSGFTPDGKPNVLVECYDINMMVASLKGVLADFGNGEGFVITLSKQTIDDPDPKPEEPKVEFKEPKVEFKEVKKDKKEK